MKSSRITTAAKLAALFGGLGATVPRALRGSRYKPHQSAREKARRVGGKTWANHKRLDRIDRGLPPKKN